MTTRFFGKYEIIQRLGRGGMAEVYQARDPDLDRLVAIKVILPHLVTEAGFAERFRREARVVASLRHPHIVQLFDFGVLDEQWFMVMEYLGGGTLRDRLAALSARGERMPLAEAASLVRQIADALDYAHERGIVHRDIKPANILFTPRGEPVLSDFGVLKLLNEATQQLTHGIVGSPAYMSPEQAADQPIELRSDVYSLGVVLYELVVGRLPFMAESPTALLLKHLTEPPPPPRQLNPRLSPAVEQVVLAALAKTPSDRPASAGELARALHAALADTATAVPTIDQAAPDPLAQTVADLPGEASSAPHRTLPVAPGHTASEPSHMGQLPSEAAAAAGSLRTLPDAALPTATAAPTRPDQSPATLPPQPPASLRERRPWPGGRLPAALRAEPRLFVAILFAIVGLVLGGAVVMSQPARLPASWTGILILAAALAFTISGATALIGVLRADTGRQRRRAGLLLALVPLLALAWGTWLAASRSPSRARLRLAIGEFDGARASRSVDFARRIDEQLQRELAGFEDAVEVLRTGETYADAPAARARGADLMATVVIWGWYDDAGVSPHIEVLRLPPLRRELVSVPFLVQTASAAESRATPPPETRIPDLMRFVRTPTQLPEVDLFVRNGPQQIAHVATAILGFAFAAGGDSPRALQLLDRAVASAPTAGGEFIGLELIYFQRATELQRQGRLADAIRDLERAIAIKPDLAAAHHNLAIAHAENCTPTRRLDAAIAAGEAAVQLTPNDPATRLLMGDLYRQAGQYDQAIAEFEAGLRLDPQNAELHELLSEAQAAAGQPDAAKASRQTAIRLREQTPSQPADMVRQQIALGDSYVAAGEHDKALAAYRAALATDAGNPAARRGLGLAYYWKGEWVECEREYRAWVDAAPMNPIGHLVLGLFLAERGRTAEAIDELETTIRLAPCNAAAHLALARLYWQQGDSARAEAALETARRLETVSQGR